MRSSGFVPLIRKPTRITKRTAILIDNIFTTIINQTEHFNGILINDISDHLPVFTITKLDKYSQTIEPGLDAYTTRIITNSSLESFAQKLQQCDWQSTLSESDPIVSYEAFVKEFLGQYDKCFPIKRIKSKNAKRSENAWISIGLRKLSKTKEKLYKKFLTNKTVESETKYKVYRNELNHLIRIAKKNYYNNRFSQAHNNLKSTWKVINELAGKKQSTRLLPSSFKVENNEVNDTRLIANQFNEFFVNVGPNLAKKFSNVTDGFRKYLKGDYLDSMFLHDTTTDEVNRIIEKLDCKTSCGIDQISSKVVKYVAPYILIPLSYIFNLTFATGSIPGQLKITLVTPVYKSSDKNIFSNYRPISVLPCFSKVLEKFMYKRLIAYIDKNRILTDRQYGFRSKSSTNHAIIELVDKITKAIENNEYTVGIFLDLSKTFDTVNHDILLTKLDFY